MSNLDLDLITISHLKEDLSLLERHLEAGKKLNANQAARLSKSHMMILDVQKEVIKCFDKNMFDFFK